MYAIISSGGKQYKVSKDTILSLEKLQGDLGSKIEFDQVLMVSDSNKNIQFGSPFVKAKVKGEIVQQTRAPKVIIFKKNRRHNYRRKNGHKQHVTHVKITDIVTG